MIVPGTPEHLPAKGRFMETAGIEPALCSRRDRPPPGLHIRARCWALALAFSCALWAVLIWLVLG